RGPRARLLRMELVTLLERAGRDGEALEALKQAVKMEPGHREGWLAYAERLISLANRDGEAAWALEHAATATDDPAQRHKLWLRLARFVREQLGDETRAQTYETRAEKLQREHPGLGPAPRPAPIRARDPFQTQPLAPEPLPGGPLVIPARRGLKPKVSGPQLTQAQQDAFEKLAEKLGARVEPEDKSRSHVRVAPRVAKALAEMHKEPLIPPRPGPPVPDLEPAVVPFEEDDDEPVAQTSELPVDEDELPTPAPAAPGAVEDYEPEEISSEDLEVPDERERLKGPVPQAQDDDEEVADGRRTAELRVELGDPQVAVPPSFGPSPSRALSAERTALFERVRSNPLEADGYRLLAEHFDTANDPARSSLMLEIARALEGDPHAAPRAPRLILNATDRAGLKHPSLRGEGGELLSLIGVALCKLNPARGREAGTDDEFHLEAGKGARAISSMSDERAGSFAVSKCSASSR
ncbi:MAG TPA: tetratricopeptide repeat protein, partial [Archangium sp.]